MALNEIKLMEAGLRLQEELNFSAPPKNYI